ncbi:MAG: hypothetical protein V7K40_15150 [Nostoc sp.]
MIELKLGWRYALPQLQSARSPESMMKIRPEFDNPQLGLLEQ